MVALLAVGRAGYFYPRSPCGERRYGLRYSTQSRHFYPRSPCGERPSRSRDNSMGRHISIHALLAESDPYYGCEGCSVFISIHARLAECDSFKFDFILCHSHFYPRSPCGERRHHRSPGQGHKRISIHALLAESDMILMQKCFVSIFLSTLSLRRATHQLCEGNQQPDDFYPRSPCGERLAVGR